MTGENGIMLYFLKRKKNCSPPSCGTDPVIGERGSSLYFPGREEKCSPVLLLGRDVHQRKNLRKEKRKSEITDVKGILQATDAHQELFRRMVSAGSMMEKAG